VATGKIIDVIPPTAPIAIYPISGETFGIVTINLNRSGSSDDGIGMSGYYREISTGTLFDTGTIIKTGILIT